MGQTVESQFQRNVVDRAIGGVQQSHGVVQPALQHILVQGHACVLKHQSVQVVGIVVQVLSDLSIGHTASGMMVDILDDLQDGVIVNITQLLMPDQINEQIFELHGVLFTEENLLDLKFLDDFADFRL